MYTLYGREAKDGDFVLVLDVNYNNSIATVHVAKVKGKKAYAAVLIANAGKCRWLRKESAIIALDPSNVSELHKKLIDMNMESKKAAFDINDVGLEHVQEIFKLMAELKDVRTEEIVAKYGEEYRHYYK